MASSDWTECTGNVTSASLDRGVTAGIAAPPGGGSFVYGFNSLAVVSGAAGLFANQANFAPMAKGGSVRGAVQRGVSGGPTNFSPFLFVGLGGPSTSDHGYLLGLQDDDPHRIALRKGPLSDGIPAGAPGSLGILARSTASYAPGTWLHLRLDMIVNGNGDVVLNCYQNDLTVGGASVATPNWQPIPGIAQFIDDALGVNSGSVPYTSGRAGFAMVVKDVTRRAFFDQIEILRQL